MMKRLIEDYYKGLATLIGSTKAADRDRVVMNFSEGVERACSLVLSRHASGNKLMFIGNGASAAISSHMATDFWKTGGIRAVAFNDSSLLTCIGNDYGYEYVFEKPVEMFADKGDILVAVSSSGKSKNIIQAVSAARSKGCSIITLSGFEPENPLSRLGDVNFYVPANAYGPVEVMHHSICHCILDTIVRHNLDEG
jgi:D-sedoheptulose 7-phosphate isomerase